MSADPIHFEVFARETSGSPWSLEFANEDRDRALEAAEDLLQRGLAAAVKVSRETLDPETGVFDSAVILSKRAY